MFVRVLHLTKGHVFVLEREHPRSGGLHVKPVLDRNAF